MAFSISFGSIKPSEISEKTSIIIKKIVVNTFDNNEIKVILGGAKTAQKLLKLKFNHILFIGSPSIGKIVMQEAAKNLDLNVADKPDSQDICFVPNGDYSSVIRKFRPDSFQKGNIRNLDGKVIGVHDGIINFTIGQRKGIKISNNFM